MATLTLKQVPDDLYRRLKERAATHRRSLNNEAIVCLEQMLRSQPVDPASWLEKARALRGRASKVYLTDDETFDLVDWRRLDALVDLFGANKRDHYVDEFRREAQIRLDRMAAALGDQPGVSAAAHDIASLAGNLGLVRLCAQCRALMAEPSDAPRRRIEHRVAALGATVADSVAALAAGPPTGRPTAASAGGPGR